MDNPHRMLDQERKELPERVGFQLWKRIVRTIIPKRTPSSRRKPTSYDRLI
jgi:hypothetical protein